jgi:tRNA-dihydrouridine synthase B
MKPLVIGSLSFAHHLIQGPLAGYSCAPFRKLFSQFSAPAYCVTEMISALDLTRHKNLHSRYLWRDPAEERLCYQLSGNCPTTLRAATAIVSDLGADLIDLNCGCPKQKIRKKKCGSYLLTQPQLIGEIVANMKSATQAAVTVKIRVDNQSDSHLLVAEAATQAGADALIVHGRHWSEGYDTPCRTNSIREIVKAVTIPVIANGDVSDIASLNSMLETGAAGVMISRAGTGKPWLFQQLLQEMSGKIYTPPTLDVIIELFTQHVTGLADLEGEFKASLQNRKLLPYYFRDYFSPERLTTLMPMSFQNLLPALRNSPNP